MLLVGAIVGILVSAVLLLLGLAAVFLWHVRAGRREVVAIVAGGLIAAAVYLLVFLLLWRLLVRS